MQDVYKRMNATPTPLTLNSLQHQINQLKSEIQTLKNQYNNLQIPSPDNPSTSNSNPDNEIDQFLGEITEYKFQKWYTKILLKLPQFSTNFNTLLDSGVDINCISEGLVPTKFCEFTNSSVSTAIGKSHTINYKLTNAYICKNKTCFPVSFVIVKDLQQEMILGTPFLLQIQPFEININGLKAINQNL